MCQACAPAGTPFRLTANSNPSAAGVTSACPTTALPVPSPFTSTVIAGTAAGGGGGASAAGAAPAVSSASSSGAQPTASKATIGTIQRVVLPIDRKSTRLNSSH